MLDEQMDIAFREGLIDAFDATEIPNVKSLYSISTPAKWQKDGKFYAVHQNGGQLGLTYRADKVKTPPKEWLDFWKPEYREMVGMPPISYSVGLQFFIATIHALGGDERNPADVGAIQQLLERGDIGLVPLWDGRAHGLAAAGCRSRFRIRRSRGPWPA